MSPPQLESNANLGGKLTALAKSPPESCEFPFAEIWEDHVRNYTAVVPRSYGLAVELLQRDPVKGNALSVKIAK